MCSPALPQTCNPSASASQKLLGLTSFNSTVTGIGNHTDDCCYWRVHLVPRDERNHCFPKYPSQRCGKQEHGVKWRLDDRTLGRSKKEKANQIDQQNVHPKIL